MANTEKPTTIAEQKKKGVGKPMKPENKDLSKAQKQIEEKKSKKSSNEKVDLKDTSSEEKKEVKKEVSKIKKTEAKIDVTSIPISSKDSFAICRFIKGKEIEKAIKDLEEVMLKKRAIPMKGEIPHRKGKIMSGRYATKATQNFIKLLKSLLSNANMNGLENPIIDKAIANFASRPLGKFGRVQRKRTHIKLIAKEKIKIKK